jgi:ATP-dependent protease Clp ATPase subunit
MDVMFEIPDDASIQKCIVDKNAALKKAKPKLVASGATKETA